MGIVAGILLVRQSQDIREMASGDECSPEGSQCIANRCLGYCGLSAGAGTTLVCIDAADDCPPNYIVTDGDCKPPRYLQNGRCIGNSGRGGSVSQYINKNKCKTDDDCAQGKHCFMGILCVK